MKSKMLSRFSALFLAGAMTLGAVRLWEQRRQHPAGQRYVREYLRRRIR